MTSSDAVIAEHLSKEGFVVAQAPTGSNAQERLQGFAYDGLVIDLRCRTPTASRSSIGAHPLPRHGRPSS